MCAQKSVKVPLRIPFPAVIDVSIGIGILLIGRMFLSLGLLPLRGIQLREEGGSVGESVVDAGDIQAIGEGKGLPIDLSTSDDEHLLLACAQRQGLGKRSADLTAWEIGIGLGRQNDIPAIGQGVRQRLEGLATHDDGMSGGQCLEPF